MRREATRTLYSLTTAYQKNIHESDYEVTAVDSSSTDPLDEDLVNSFGPQFRYLEVNWEYPSPCKAMNIGVKHSHNSIVLCIVDGARILSPGILYKTQKLFNSFKNPVVYTLGMHIGNKLQNESLLEGYNQKVEDNLIRSTKWRENGYQLFNISSLASSSKKGYFSKISESNCIALTKKLYKKMGGFDERFISAGGGLCNLDFFHRVMENHSCVPIMLLGEATFHQFHGGVATNVSRKNHPWRLFSEEYKKIRGKEFQKPTREPLFFGDITKEASNLVRLI